MKKLFITFFALGILASCDQGFKYNRQTACEIRYGYGINGFSVIVDGDKKLIRNNREMGYGDIVTVGAIDRSYITMGRYFPDSDTDKFIQSLKKSKKLYMRWRQPDEIRGGDIYTTIIDVSDFSGRYNKCLENPGPSSSTKPVEQPFLKELGQHLGYQTGI